ncbi:MAG TPA: GNAT family protein [Candidatus Dormibacteraeota bacterium]|nr:GNAT family protein [Candidatus Dormibacteraeota bacterium]
MATRTRVRLRKVTVADAELLDLWRTPEYKGEFNDFGIPSRPARPLIEKNGMLGEDDGTLIVEVKAGGRPVGAVSWRSVRYGPNPESRAWNIGIILAPDERGRGFGTQAQRMLAEFLFANTPVNRVEAITDVENTAEQRSLERAGFRREGVLRGAQFRAGRWRDLVVYAVVRPAPE